MSDNHREAVRGTVKDTLVECSKTSEPDVYITAITPDDTTTLYLDDSTVIAGRTHVRLHLFCRQAGDVPFSGEAELTELPDDPKPRSQMSDVVKLDQDHREAVRGTVKDTLLKCSKTSAPDVYITAIAPDDTTILHLGDSTAVAGRTHVRLHLFCRQAGDVPFSGEAELKELPDDPKPKPKKKKLMPDD